MGGGGDVMEVAGKIVWITGASSGIGEALARNFSNAGAHVILSGRRVDALGVVALACRGEILELPFDVTDFDALPGIVATARSLLVRRVRITCCF